MKPYALLVLWASCLSMVSAQEATNFEKVAFGDITVTPEKYRSKNVEYSATLRRLVMNFPPYMEAAGLKSSKYILAEIGDPQLPVLVRRTDEMTALMGDLKPGSVVRVWGRVKTFKDNPRRPAWPHYYVEAKNIAVVTEPGGTRDQNQAQQDR
jgi:hypothetical protein